MNIEPIKTIIKDELNIEEKQKYEMIGEELIRNNNVAVCVLAGGQGTRLGHNGPKGTFIVELKAPKSIFEIQVDSLKRAYDKFGVYTYLYVMTSKENDEETKRFFEDNDYFNYPKDKIAFFVQGEFPLTDRDKNELKDENGKLVLAPNGNGGIFKALEDEKILDRLKENNIKYLVTQNVDNILANPIDAISLGILYSNKAEIGMKSIVKGYPDERVGNIVLKDGKPTVIEYIDFPKDLSEEQDENGELKYKEAHFGVNYLSIELLERISREKLPIHEALKSNEKYGNFIKYEMFIFDGFEKAKNGLVVRVRRENEFAPIKNKEGQDSPKTAIMLYNGKFRQLKHCETSVFMRVLRVLHNIFKIYIKKYCKIVKSCIKYGCEYGKIFGNGNVPNKLIT